MSRYVRVRKPCGCSECRRIIYVGERCLRFRANGEDARLCAHCEAMARRVERVALDWSVLLDDTPDTVTGLLSELVSMAEADESPLLDELKTLRYCRTRGWHRPDGSLMPVPELPTEADHEL